MNRLVMVSESILINIDRLRRQIILEKSCDPTFFISLLQALKTIENKVIKREGLKSFGELLLDGDNSKEHIIDKITNIVNLYNSQLRLVPSGGLFYKIRNLLLDLRHEVLVRDPKFWW